MLLHKTWWLFCNHYTCRRTNSRVSAMSLLPSRPKPNILVLWGDDIGQSNISAYTHGLVGYKTPNIDRPC